MCMKSLKLLFFAILASVAMTACIEDGLSTSPSDQPSYSTDTLDMGLFFTGRPTPTYQFVVYNRHDKIMNISDIHFRDNQSGIFRMNVDGSAGERFSNIEIRPNDSIYVFVEATLPRGERDDVAQASMSHIDFSVNGVVSSVVVKATGRNVEALTAVTLTEDTRLTADIPYQIFDSLVVAEGVTLTLEPGVELFFHDKSNLIVRGRLRSEGTAEAPVTMGGDRTDNVVGQIPFDLMASQWDGVYFTATSAGSRLSHTVIKNMTTGVMANDVPAAADGSPGLEIINCRIRNSAYVAFGSFHSDIRAVGTEFSDAAQTPLYIEGGHAEMAHLTVANYYLFAPPAIPCVTLSHYNAESVAEGYENAPYLSARFVNCIFYGLGSDFSPSDLKGTDVTIRRSVFKSKGTDDDNFIDCIWDTDPLYRTIREDYIFDYRVKDDSPVIGAGDPTLTPADALTDFYGVVRATPNPTPGAFEWTPEPGDSEAIK